MSVRIGPVLLAASLASAIAGVPRPSRMAEPLFVESAAATGLAFTHHNGATGQYYMPELMGAGVALLDYDGDGDLDVFLVDSGSIGGSAAGSGTSRLFRNDLSAGAGGRRTLRFTDVTSRAGIGVACIRNGCGRRGLRQRRRPRPLSHVVRSRRALSQQRRRHVYRCHRRGGRERPALEHERRVPRLRSGRRPRSLRRQLPRLCS